MKIANPPTTAGEALAQHLLFLRQRDRLTQSEIALRSGLPLNTIELIESGMADELPVLEFLQLAAYFGCSSELIDRLSPPV